VPGPLRDPRNGSGDDNDPPMTGVFEVEGMDSYTMLTVYKAGRMIAYVGIVTEHFTRDMIDRLEAWLASGPPQV